MKTETEKNNEQGSLEVQTVRADGSAPKRRIATPAAAQAAYYSARQNERQRDARFGDIMGIYSGFPPVRPSIMEEMGMGDMPNVNLKQFQAKIDQYVDVWRRVNTSGRTWYDVKAKHADPREAQRRSTYLTECFNRAIRRWDSTDFRQSSGYILRCTARDTQMGLFAIGISHFNDSIDWRWQMRPTRKVLVPYGTQISQENCSVMFIEDDTISVTQLYSMKGKPGWNEKAILYNLYLRTNQQNAPNLSRAFVFSEWVDWIRNNESWLWDTQFNPVRVIHCYVREFSEDANEFSITHTIFMDTQATGVGTLNDSDKASADKSNTGWLFEKEKCAKRWSEVVAVFADNAGPEMDWHGVKGFGDLIYDQSHQNNLMYNRTCTSAIIANMPIFVGADENQRQKLNQVTFSFGAIQYPDMGTLTQMKIVNDIKGAADVFMLGTQSLDQISRTNPINQAVGPEKTATQETYERMAQTELTGLQLSNYLATGGDALGAEMYRRIAQPGSKYPKAHPGGNVAELFRKEAQEYGIPENELLEVESVTATRQGGSGSMAVDVAKAKEAMAVATPGPGQLFARKLIAYGLGYSPDVVDSLIEESAPPPDEEDVIISQENLAIQNGQAPQAFGFQPHEKHIRQPSGNDHLNVLAGIEQIVTGLLKQGIQPNQIEDAVKLHNSMDAGIAHCEQHIAFMQELPRTGGRPSIYEGFIKEMKPLLNNLRQLSRSFAELIASAQEAAQQQPQNMSPEMLKAQMDIQIAQMKAENDIQIKQAMADAKMGNQALLQQSRSRMKEQDAEMKIGLEAQQKAFDLQTQRAQAQQALDEKAGLAQVELATKAAQGEQKIQIERQKAAEKPETTE